MKLLKQNQKNKVGAETFISDLKQYVTHISSDGVTRVNHDEKRW